MGELLVVECEGRELKLDAMLLEGLSWQQDPSGLAEFVPTAEDVLEDSTSSYANEVVEQSDSFTISNEYTTVELGTVETGEAMELQLRSDKGASVLGLQTLAALTEIENTRRFSQWFRTPIGPEQPL